LKISAQGSPQFQSLHQFQFGKYIPKHPVPFDAPIGAVDKNDRVGIAIAIEGRIAEFRTDLDITTIGILAAKNRCCDQCVPDTTQLIARTIAVARTADHFAIGMRERKVVPKFETYVADLTVESHLIFVKTLPFEHSFLGMVFSRKVKIARFAATGS